MVAACNVSEMGLEMNKEQVVGTDKKSADKTM
jgi:hypothetical protein